MPHLAKCPSPAGLLGRLRQPDGTWAEPAFVANGWLADGVGNSDGVLLVGVLKRWYGSSQPLSRTAPAASVFLPAP